MRFNRYQTALIFESQKTVIIFKLEKYTNQTYVNKVYKKVDAKKLGIVKEKNKFYLQ